LKYKK